MSAIAGEGTGMERDYDFSSTLHAADLEAPKRSDAAPASARSSVSTRARWRRGACRWCSTRGSPARWSGILASAVNGSAIARKTSFLRERLGERIFASGIDIIDDPLRPRGLRSRPFDAEGVAGRRAQAGRGRRAQDLAPRLRHRARARPRNHRPCAARRFLDARRPAPAIFTSRPATRRRSELIDDIEDGFYVTDLIGMGVNLVTGDYSRGAVGILDRERRVHLSGERGHHRRPPPRNVHEPGAGERPRVPLRHQRADGACRGSDRCRPSDVADSPLAAARLARCVREAGALALRCFRQPIKTWTKGRLLAGQRSRHRGRPVCCASGSSAIDRRLGWLSEETDDDPARLSARAVSGSSIRSTARALISPARRIGRLGGAGGERPAGRRLPLCAGDARSSSWRSPAHGATRNGVAIAATRRGDARRRPHRRPEKLSRQARRASRRLSPSCRACVRWRCASRGSRRAHRRRYCRRQQP